MNLLVNNVSIINYFIAVKLIIIFKTVQTINQLKSWIKNILIKLILSRTNVTKHLLLL